MVRLHSQGVQGAGGILNLKNGGEPALEPEMSTIATKPEALSPEGDILVFAPPLILGFLGAPLALAMDMPKRRMRKISGRNWAKRRAYGA
jgi:hypothetical protein